MSQSEPPRDPLPPPASAAEAEPARSPWLPGPGGDARRSAGLDDLLRPGPRPVGRGWRAALPGPRGALLQVLAGLVVVWLGFTSLHLLAPGEDGTVTTLGRFDHAIGPGLNLTWPWPVQAVAVRGGHADLIEVPGRGADNLVLTGDGYLVNLGWRLRYHVDDPRRFAAVARGDAVLRGAGAAAVRAGLAGSNLVALMGGAGRDAFELSARGRAQAVADRWALGVRIESLELSRVEVPARLNEAWARVAAAQGDVARLQDQTEAYAREVNVRAEADAGAFAKALEQYRAAPAITRRRLYYEMMDNVLARNPKVVGGGGTLALPPPKKTGAGGTP